MTPDHPASPEPGPIPVTSPGPVPVTAVATAATVLAVLPIFLLGGLAALVRAELGFDEARLGVIAGTYFASSALTAFAAGWLVERVGMQRGYRLGVLMAVVTLVGIAALARNWWHLLVLMAVGGLVNSIMQPAANLAVARGVSARRQGIAFGVKQAAIPISTLLAGLSVPLVGLTVGWRWAFAGAAALAVPLYLAVPRAIPNVAPAAHPPVTAPAAHPPAAVEPRRPLRGLLPATIAIGCAAAAANTLGAFYVESAAAGGQPLSRAGLLLSLGSATGITVRLAAGWLADRLDVDPYLLVSVLLAFGALGYLALGLGLPTATLVIATMVVFGAGWGFPGLFHLAVVRANLDAPAAATGITQTGVFLGSFLGPVGFGWIVSVAGYRAAWTTAAGSAALGASLLTLDRFRTRRRARLSR